MVELELLTAEDLARILKIKPTTVTDRLYRRPHTLPPRVKNAGKALWLPSVVETWLKEQSE